MTGRKIVACLYLDNQEQIGYPIEHVIKSVGFADEWLFAAASEEQAKHLTPFGRTITTGVRILSSSDISNTMNAVRNRAFEETDADFVVLVQADTMSTPELNTFMRLYVERRMELDQGRWFVAADSQLYLHFQSGWGYSVVGREWAGRFHADGLSNTIKWVWEDGFPDAPSCLHVGYLSSLLARRHRRWAAHLWNVPEHIGLIDSMDDEAFIYWHLDHVQNHAPKPLTPIEQVDPRFGAAIDAMGLREDQARVYRVLERWQADHP
jgi:hypothetical protein